MRKKEIKEDSDVIFRLNDRAFPCPFELTMKAIEGKWKLKVMKRLIENGRIRYGALKNLIRENITHKMLIQSLRELESDGLVKRIVYPEIPPRVEYLATPKGAKLSSVIDAMNKFGALFAEKR